MCVFQWFVVVEFFVVGYQIWYFMFCDFDFGVVLVCEFDVFDDVVSY